MGVTIVGVPRDDDPVWRVSSEKVPHLTILFLGDVDNLDRTTAFVEHAVKTSLEPFGAGVDRRGELGDKSADVLFFNKNDVKMVADFRTALLSNDDIRKSYDAVEQYPQWTPHLTLGYPETPAKPDNRDWPGIDWVRFDRIALWTGDYEGVEFPLKNDTDVELSMSAKGEAFLQHYGVKGMKWGVIRSLPKVAGVASTVAKSGATKIRSKADYDEFAKTSEDAKRAAQLRAKTKVVGVQTLSNRELQQIITRMNLEVQYKNLKSAEFEQSYVGKGALWAGRFVGDVAKDAASSWLKRPGSNFSGRTSARAKRIVMHPVIDGEVVQRSIGR